MTRRHGSPHCWRRCAGLSLVELLIVLMVTGLMGVAIASMLAAVSYGSDASRDLRDVSVKAKALGERITQAVRTAHGVIDYDDDYIELRMSEDEGSGSDVLRIEHDEADNAIIRRFRAAGSATWESQTWGRDVSGWSVSVDAPDAEDVALVSFRLTLSVGALERVAIGAASLRN